MEGPNVVLANARIVRGLEDPVEIVRTIEMIGRICHGSRVGLESGSSDKFVRMLVRLGHESVLEHISVTVLVECDRAMAQQWTRHRLAAYTMESQRYVSYKDVRFVDPEFRSVCPVDSRHYTRDQAGPVPDDIRALYLAFDQSCADAERGYRAIRSAGAPPEDARAVLPNSARTVFYTTANLRSWRHFIAMRCAPGAQHNIQRVAMDLLKQFYGALPSVFFDLGEKYL